jgi:cytoskeletal protein CcmA (bactofilin family)
MAEQSDLGTSTTLPPLVANTAKGINPSRPSTDFTASLQEAFTKPIPNLLRPAGMGLRSRDAISESRDSAVEARKLVVSKGVALSGEINHCDTLFVEGSVEAKLECQDLVIGETGNFDGVAAMDNAEVRGRYNGDLVVRKRLTIHATGRVTGTISYREIEIEPGGKISGDVRAVGDDLRPDRPKAADLKHFGIELP